MVKKIIHIPHKTLNQVAKPIVNFDVKTQKLAEDLIDTLKHQKDPIGVGLSANQIDVLQRACVIKPDEEGPITVMINPEIIDLEEGPKDRKPTLEGCLSIPEIWGHVMRPYKVYIRFQDVQGNEQKEWYVGFASVVVQHEIDHLDGILFTQRVLEQGYDLFKEKDGELHPYSL